MTFGFGLSYTSFDYANLRLSRPALAPGETLEVSVDVTNTGPRTGMEVVQLYVRDERSKVQRPEKELKGFAKVELQPGETRSVSFQLGQEALAFFDDGLHCWVAETGTFQVLLGSSSQQIRAAAAFNLSATAKFGGRPQLAARLGLESTMKEILENDEAVAVLERHVPGAIMAAHGQLVQSFTLRKFAENDPSVFTETILQAIVADLENI